MRRKSYADMRCSIAQTLEVVGDPWTLLIVRDVLFGIHRFDELHRRLGIPRTTLVDRLATLTDHGIVERRRYQDHPPRDEYVLTPKGRDLRDVLVTLMAWGDRWSALEAPPVVLVDRTTGRTLDPVLVDRATGSSLDALEVQAVAGPGADPRTAPPARPATGEGSRRPAGRRQRRRQGGAA